VRIGIAIALVALALLAMVGIAPYVVASSQPLRDWALRLVLPKLQGSATAASVSLSWQTPVAFSDIVIRAPNGALVAEIDQLRGDLPLWRYLFHPADVGHYRLDHPHVYLTVREGGSNLSDTFVEMEERPTESVGMTIVDGRFSYQAPTHATAWRIAGINVSLRLEPVSAAGDLKRQMVLLPGGSVEHVPITPQISQGVLSSIAPVLANSSRVAGVFTLKLGLWQLPLPEMSNGKGEGELVIHHAEMEPGPLVQGLASALDLSPGIHVPDNTVVPFRMADRRIHHHGLQFDIDNLTVRTHGSVGLDESLDLVAEVHLPDDLADRRPILKALASQTIEVPVRGTSSRPRIDMRALGRANAGVWLGVIEDWLRERALRRR
jgi:hypothetical protein